MQGESSEIAVKALLSLLLIDTLDFLNVGKTMSDKQVAQTVDLILEDYSVYKIDYFVLCFNKAKKGYYGKLYDRVDGQIILDWLRQYDLDYQLEIENERVNEKKRLDRGDDQIHEDAVPMPGYVKDMISNIGPEEKSSTPVRSRSEQDLFIDQVIADFNSLHDGSPGKKFVPVGDKMLDINEYIFYRVNTEQ